jgi:nitrate reductase NapE
VTAYPPIQKTRRLPRERVAGATMSDWELAGRCMSDTSNRQGGTQPAPEAVLAPGRRAEFFVFAIIAGFIWPVVAVGVVGGYGFFVWMSQMILGPPGPPGG